MCCQFSKSQAEIEKALGLIQSFPFDWDSIDEIMSKIGHNFSLNVIPSYFYTLRGYK